MIFNANPNQNILLNVVLHGQDSRIFISQTIWVRVGGVQGGLSVAPKHPQPYLDNSPTGQFPAVQVNIGPDEWFYPFVVVPVGSCLRDGIVILVGKS